MHDKTIFTNTKTGLRAAVTRHTRHTWNVSIVGAVIPVKTRIAAFELARKIISDPKLYQHERDKFLLSPIQV